MPRLLPMRASGRAACSGLTVDRHIVASVCGRVLVARTVARREHLDEHSPQRGGKNPAHVKSISLPSSPLHVRPRPGWISLRNGQPTRPDRQQANRDRRHRVVARPTTTTTTPPPPNKTNTKAGLRFPSRTPRR
jgi:hypothetical protein